MACLAERRSSSHDCRNSWHSSHQPFKVPDEGNLLARLRACRRVESRRMSPPSPGQGRPKSCWI
eukprot:1606636-Pyramimonas_sp.AAC.1